MSNMPKVASKAAFSMLMTPEAARATMITVMAVATTARSKRFTLLPSHVLVTRKELAQRTGLPLATLDGDLREATQAEGVDTGVGNMSTRFAGTLYSGFTDEAGSTMPAFRLFG